MAHHAVRRLDRSDEFARLHRLFVEHVAFAVLIAWAAAVTAAAYAPWLHNIRALIDPTGRAESTGSFLFALPTILTLGWISVACGGDLMRRSTMLRSHAAEFAVAGAVAFAVFCLAIHRVVVAVSLTA